jgi:hypothetical protein
MTKLHLPTWDHRAWGTAKDPVRQSGLNAFSSQDGCAKRYKYERDAEARGETRESQSQMAPWKRTLGTAVHATIERALKNEQMRAAVLAGRVPQPDTLTRVMGEEMLRAAEGLKIDWGKDNEQNELIKARWMVIGALRTVSVRALSIVAVEAPFLVQIGDYHATGTIDLLFEPREQPGTVSVADWKTGERKAAPAVLDHGYQVSIYAEAIEHGVLFPGTEQEMRLAAKASDVFVVQLREYVAIERMRAAHRALSNATLTRAELEVVLARAGWELNAASVAALLTAANKAGIARKLRRGKDTYWEASGSIENARLDADIWHRSKRAADDRARLLVSMKNIIGTARMGRFLERLGEQCSRCSYRLECLNEGHDMSAANAREINDALEGLDLAGLLPEVA